MTSLTPGGEAAEKAVQFRQGVEERAVREEAVHGLVDLPQPQGEEEPGEDAGPGEQGAQRKEKTVWLASQHAGPGLRRLHAGRALKRRIRAEAWRDLRRLLAVTESRRLQGGFRFRGNSQQVRRP